jgi:hypothetical protein
VHRASLRRLGRNEFGGARATDDLSGLRYPVFLRSERLHSGALSPLLRSVGEVESAIGRALVLGHPLQDLMVLEFCDTPDADGFYRKYAAFIVGDRILPRSLNYGRGWMLKHAQTEFSRPMVLEERDYVFGNPHERELAEIFAIARVEYGRIGYAVKNGRIQTWEINLNATIGRGPRPSRRKLPKELESIRLESKDHFYRGFEGAWKSVDLDSGGRPPASIALDPRLLRAAPLRRRPANRLLRAVRGVLRPFRPLLEPLARPVFPVLGRLARHGRSRA